MPTRNELGWPPIQRGVSELLRSDRIGDDVRREIVFEPGHPRTILEGPGPKSTRDYGVGSLGIRFLLHGPRGTIQFAWRTGIIPERVTRRINPALDWDFMTELSPFDVEEWMTSSPSGVDLGYHADSPVYDGQEPYGKCEYRPTGTCYYDGSGLAAEALLARFLLEGEAVVWETLEERYLGWLEGKDDEEGEG